MSSYPNMAHEFSKRSAYSLNHCQQKLRKYQPQENAYSPSAFPSSPAHSATLSTPQSISPLHMTPQHSNTSSPTCTPAVRKRSVMLWHNISPLYYNITLSKRLADCSTKKDLHKQPCYSELLPYGNYRGSEPLRNAMARFIMTYAQCTRHLKSDNFFVINGLQSALQQFVFSIANDGDYIMVPVPCSPDIRNGVESNFGVKILPLLVEQLMTQSDNSQILEIKRNNLEGLYKTAVKQGKRVKGIIFSNPHLPSGYILNQVNLQVLQAFAGRHTLHMLLVEQYLPDCQRKDLSITSVHGLISTPDWKRTHVLCDFGANVGLSTLNLCAFYTLNEYLRSAFFATSYYYSVSTLTQHILLTIIKDIKWLNDIYWPEKLLKLQLAQYKVLKILIEPLNIPFVMCTSSPCDWMWICLAQWLPKQTYDMEYRLAQYILQHNEMITIFPGYFCISPKPGWMMLNVVGIKEQDFEFSFNQLKTTLEHLTPDMLFSMPSNDLSQISIMTDNQSINQDSDTILETTKSNDK